MKRYKINNALKRAIIASNQNLRELKKELGFEIRNVLYKNSSINEIQLKKLEDHFNKKFNLKRMYINYGKNLSDKSVTQSIKKVQKGGNLAEIMGIMLGDGNLWKNRIRIAFDKRAEGYINYVSLLFHKIFGIKLKKEVCEKTNQAYLYCTNLFAVEQLLDAGLQRGNKIKNKLGVPLWIKENKNYSRKCLRGVIDTDGCIYFSKRDKQTYIKFTNFNKALLKDFKLLTKSLGYSFARANKNNWCLYRKEEVARFINEIKPFKSMGL